MDLVDVFSNLPKGFEISFHKTEVDGRRIWKAYNEKMMIKVIMGELFHVVVTMNAHMFKNKRKLIELHDYIKNFCKDGTSSITSFEYISDKLNTNMLDSVIKCVNIIDKLPIIALHVLDIGEIFSCGDVDKLPFESVGKHRVAAI
jgi:hypothetical protein